jgi:capsule polysaccharide export protein KpsC/LpsZ
MTLSGLGFAARRTPALANRIAAKSNTEIFRNVRNTLQYPAGVLTISEYQKYQKKLQCSGMHFWKSEIKSPWLQAPPQPQWLALRRE